MHSPEHKRKKHEARQDALHHFHNSAVDGPHQDMKRDEMMYAHPGDRRFKSKTETLAEDMVKDAAKEGLHMEIER